MRYGAALLSAFAAFAAAAQETTPQARPGECYATVFVPPVFETRSEEVLKTPASEQVRVVPARYEWREEKVTVPAGEVSIAVKPAEYAVTEEKVLAAPAGEKTVTIPAVYRTVEERVPVKTGPMLKPGHSSGDKHDAILCLVEQPVEYRLVKKKILVTPARTEKIQVPAQYQTVKRKKLLKPAETKTVMARERTRTKRVKVMVEPPKHEVVPVPAVYETVKTQVMTEPGRMEWRAVLCSTNATPGLIADLQRALQKTGHYKGRIDGRYGDGTGAAVLAYQQAESLPQHGVTLETLDRLGVKP